MFRVLQGFSAAVMIPAALAVVVSSFPIGERGKALAIFFGVSGGLTAIGPIAGGYLTQWTWRAIFWINVPIAVIAVVIALMAHITTSGRREPIALSSAALAALGMGLSVFGFEQAGSWGWSDVRTWPASPVAWWSSSSSRGCSCGLEYPLIKVRIFADRAFLVDNVVLFFSMIAFVPVFFFASVYSAVSLGYDANNAGLYLLVFFGGFAPAAQIGGRILDSRGARPALIAGSAIGMVGFVLWAVKLTDLQLGSQWYAIVLAGAGIGLILGPSSTDAVNRAIGASYGEVTGISQTVRNYGSALGLAVLGTLLGNVFTSRLTDSALAAGVPRPDAAATAAGIASSSSGGAPASSGGVASGVAAKIGAAIPQDFAVATRAVLIGMAVALSVCLVASMLHPGGVVTHEKPGEQPLTVTPEAV